jgi:polynucleotide 5'-hydroxyl-kinase GRC3/NOL9
VTAAALAAVERAAVTVVIGAGDTGKTTLVACLATHLFTHGFRVAVVDADVGQSELGPPTTIAMARVTRPLAGLGDAEVQELYFAGATSPAMCFEAVVAGTRIMTERARAACDRVLVDTSGLVTGDLGLALKRAKLDALAPDLVVCLQRSAECEHILARYAAVSAPCVLRLAASPQARLRSTAARRAHRRDALARHLAPARRVEIPLARVRDDERSEGGGDAVAETLVGIEDGTGETLGLGRVIRVDRAAKTLTIETGLEPARIVGVRIGRTRYPG